MSLWGDIQKKVWNSCGKKRKDEDIGRDITRKWCGARWESGWESRDREEKSGESQATRSEMAAADVQD